MQRTFEFRKLSAHAGAGAALMICFAVVLNGENLNTGTRLNWTNVSPAVPLFRDTRPETLDTSPCEHLCSLASGSSEPVVPTEIPPVPTSAPAPTLRAQAAILGVWAPEPSDCSFRDFRNGLLPMMINAEGAWAGKTFCVFRDKEETETGWLVRASCSNTREQWATQIRLTVKDDRLTWTSQRGTQNYARCPLAYAEARY